MTRATPAIEAVDLVKHFGETVAVDGVSFTVPEGSVLGLLGPNGAGKTTTVRMMTTLTRPTSGTGRVAGHDILTDPDAVRRSMGLTGQAATVDELLTGRENLRLIGSLYGLDPGYARFPDGLDPADLLAQMGPAALTAAVASGQPAFRSLGDQLLTERLDNLAPEQARVAAMKILSARPSRAWEPGVNQVRAWLQLSQMQSRRDLRDAVKTWDADPRKAALAELHKSSDVRARLAAAAEKTPAERWAPLARELDPRLLEQGDWPATAAMLQQAHEQGHDVRAATRGLVAEKPLGDSPARDLRYRIVSRLEIPIDTGEGTPAPTRSQGAARDRQDVRAGRAEGLSTGEPATLRDPKKPVAVTPKQDEASVQ